MCIPTAGDVVGHVEGEDVRHVDERDESAESDGAGEQEEESAEDFHAAGEDFVGLGGADGRPEHAHGRHVAEGLEEGDEAREGHLERDGLVDAIGEHLAGRGRCEEKEEPFVKSRIAGAAAVEKSP